MTGVGLIVLLMAAINHKESKTCKAVEVNINGVQRHFFVDEKDVISLLNGNGAEKMEGRPLSRFDLRKMETLLKRNLWISKAELFFDNNQVLQVSIEEREPVARVFAANGNSFYVDSSGERLPLSEKLSARVPVFTNFPSDRNRLSAADSLLLDQIRRIGGFIGQDSFWMAQVAQVDITPQRNFEIIPVIGRHIVEFGTGEDYEKKFNRLFRFYRQVLSRKGFNAYERIKVQYDRQVVGVKIGQAYSMDTGKARQLLQQMMKNGGGATAVADSVVRDSAGKTPSKPVATPPASKNPKPPATGPKVPRPQPSNIQPKQPQIRRPANQPPNRQPRAVMRRRENK